MELQKSIKLISISFVIFFSITVFVQIFKFHYVWDVLSKLNQFKICLVLAIGTQLALVLAGITGLCAAPGLFHLKKWSRQLICTALMLNICAFLFRSATRFWPNLICNYVKEEVAPLMAAKEAFVYHAILYYPSPMMTMISFLASAGMLYYFNRQSCLRLFRA